MPRNVKDEIVIGGVMLNLATKRMILASLLTVGLSTSAFAIVPDNSFYVGGQLGAARNGVTNSNIDGQQLVSTDRTGFAGRVYGGWQFNNNFGAEFGYSAFSNVKLKSINGSGSAKQQALDLVIKGTVPLNYGFGIFAEGGLAYMEDKIHTQMTNFKEYKWAPTYGIGGSYDVENIRFNLGWKRFQNRGTIQNIDFGYAGISVFFG